MRDEQFERYRQQITHAWLKTVTTLGWTLMPIFFGLDLLTLSPAAAELLPKFALYRVVATGIVFAQYIVLRVNAPGRWSLAHGYVFTFTVVTAIVMMTVDLGGFDSRYYAGILLVLTAVNMLLPWRTMHSCINGLVCIGIYLAANHVAGQPFAMQNLASNLYFLVGMVIVSTALTLVKNRLIRKEFDLRSDLVSSHAELAQSESALKSARDALWSEMEVAKRIQTSILPKSVRLPGFEIAATMLPVEDVGGDYYDIIAAPEGNWITIGDVSGHGVETGLIMMMAQTSIRSIVASAGELNPATLLARANTVIRENISRLDTARYMTVSAIRFDEGSMIASGMHQDILIYRAALGKTERIPTEGAWLGVVDRIDDYMIDISIDLEPQDIVLLFTDGITEAANADGEMFGDHRLEAALGEFNALPAEEIVQRIVARVMRFKHVVTDDMTLMVARHVPSQSHRSAD